MPKKLLDAGELETAVQDVILEVQKRALWPLHVHVIMNGAFMFATDFLRGYSTGKIAEVSFPLIRRGYSAGKVHEPRLLKSTAPDLNFKKLHSHVILDVIVEEGRTLQYYVEYFPKIIRPALIVAALIQKGDIFLPKEWIIGRRLPSAGFLYGYGMGPWRDWGAVYEKEESDVNKT